MLTVPCSSTNSVYMPPAATDSSPAPSSPNAPSSIFCSISLFLVGFSSSPRWSSPMANWPKLPAPQTNKTGAGRECVGGEGKGLKNRGKERLDYVNVRKYVN